MDTRQQAIHAIAAEPLIFAFSASALASGSSHSMVNSLFTGFHQDQRKFHGRQPSKGQKYHSNTDAMKSKLNMFAAAMLLAGLTAAPALAQNRPDARPGYGRWSEERPAWSIPGLTEDQEANIRQIHVDLQKQILQVNNQIREKEAQLRTQMTQDKPNQGQIDRLVEEIGALKIAVAKAHTAAHMKVRALLTEEQRLIFDQRPLDGRFGAGRYSTGYCYPNCPRGYQRRFNVDDQEEDK
jgi:Spy/CpxP family protein refolding chaperone